MFFGERRSEPVVGATADGRRSGDPFSSSLAPSPGNLVRGPFIARHAHVV
jgi:hypothetical protein